MAIWSLARAVKDLADVVQMADSDLPENLKEIVYLHAGLAVASGAIPIPGVDVMATVANIWTMYARINSEIGIKFSENSLKTIATGVVANIGGAVAVLALASSAAKIIPFFGSIGGGVAFAALAVAATFVSAMIYFRAITYLIKKTGSLAFSADDLKEATTAQTPSKEELKDIIKDNLPSKGEIDRLRKKAKGG